MSKPSVGGCGLQTYSALVAIAMTSALSGLACLEAEPLAGARPETNTAELAHEVIGAEDLVADVDCPGGTVLGDTCIPGQPRSTPIELCPSKKLDRAGICEPKTPQLADLECPSHTWTDDGVCRPLEPELKAWTCPFGWGDVETASGLRYCEPRFAGITCAPGELSRPGGVTCERQGPPCPTGQEEWPLEGKIRARAPNHEGRIFYVKANGGVGGTGARFQAFGTIDEGLIAAQDGDVIALGMGTHAAPTRTVARGVAIVGACVEGTRVVAEAPAGVPALLDVGGMGLVRVADVTFLRASGDTMGVHVMTNGGSLALQGVTILNAAGAALTVEGFASRASLDHVLVASTAPRADGLGGEAIVARGGGRVEIQSSTLRGSRAAGVLVSGPRSMVELTDSAVLDTFSDASASNGEGVHVELGAAFVGTRVVLSNNQSAGVLAEGAGSRVFLTDARVEHGRERIDGLGGMGLRATSGAAVSLERAAILDNYDRGIVIFGTGTTLDATDVLVRGTRAPSGSSASGLGLDVGLAQASLRRVVLEDDEVAELVVFGHGAHLFAEDLWVRAPRPTPDGEDGLGIVVGAGAEARLARALIEDTRWIGLGIRGATAVVTGEDVIVRRTGVELADGVVGHALHADEGASLRLARVVLDHTVAHAAFASGAGTLLALTDVTSQVTAAPGTNDAEGASLAIEDGARALVARASLTGAATHGVIARGPETTIALSDVRVRALGGSVVLGGNIVLRDTFGLLIEDGAAAKVQRAVVDASAKTGLLVHGRGAHLEAEDLRLREPAVDDVVAGARGVSVEAGGFVGLVRASIGDAEVGLLATGAGTNLELTDVASMGAKDRIDLASGDRAGGVGLSAVRGARVDLERFASFDAEAAAIQIAMGSSFHGQDVTMFGSRADVVLFEVVGRPRELFERVAIDGAGRSLVVADRPIPAALR